MIKLYSPRDEIEVILLKSMLEAAGIPYFVHNDHYGSLQIGPRIDLLNAKTIMVPPHHLEQAGEVIAAFIRNTETAPDAKASRYTWTDRLRMLAEAFLFNWFMPGRGRRRTPDENE